MTKCDYKTEWLADSDVLLYEAVFDVEQRKWAELSLRWPWASCEDLSMKRCRIGGEGRFDLRKGGHYVACQKQYWGWEDEKQRVFLVECAEFYIKEYCEFKWVSAASYRYFAEPDFKKMGLTVLADFVAASFEEFQPKLPEKTYSKEEVEALLNWVRSRKHVLIQSNGPSERQNATG
jgi:hypothetical protein